MHRKSTLSHILASLVNVPDFRDNIQNQKKGLAHNDAIFHVNHNMRSNMILELQLEFAEPESCREHVYILCIPTSPAKISNCNNTHDPPTPEQHAKPIRQNWRIPDISHCPP